MLRECRPDSTEAYKGEFLPHSSPTSLYTDICSSFQFDGERDTRVPHDFSNNSKLDDGLDGDDDDGEEEEPEPIVVRGSAGSKRGGGDTKPTAAAGGSAKTKHPMNKVPIHDVRVAYLSSTPKDLITDVYTHRWTPSPIVQ